MSEPSAAEDTLSIASVRATAAKSQMATVLREQTAWRRCQGSLGIEFAHVNGGAEHTNAPGCAAALPEAFRIERHPRPSWSDARSL